MGFTLIEMIAVTAIVAVLSAITLPKLQEGVERAKVAKAIGDIRVMQLDLQGLDSLPATLAGIGRAGRLDPWGRPYVYYPFPPRKGKAPPAGARRDRFLVPINSTYDLYSVGRDGKTVIALTAKASHDDVLRASDGGFIGLASRF